MFAVFLRAFYRVYIVFNMNCIESKARLDYQPSNNITATLTNFYGNMFLNICCKVYVLTSLHVKDIICRKW